MPIPAEPELVRALGCLREGGGHLLERAFERGIAGVEEHHALPVREHHRLQLG